MGDCFVGKLRDRAVVGFGFCANAGIWQRVCRLLTRGALFFRGKLEGVTLRAISVFPELGGATLRVMLVFPELGGASLRAISVLPELKGLAPLLVSGNLQAFTGPPGCRFQPPGRPA